jgi:hypothetical protein
MAVIAIPLLVGCSALGLPGLGAPPLPAVDPSGDVVASPGILESPVPVPTPMDLASADGYSLTLPAGWLSADLAATDALSLADLLAATDPTLGALARAGLEMSEARLSLVAVDPLAVAGWGPGVVIATMRTRGMPRDAARSMVEEILAGAPLVSEVVHSVVTLPGGDAHRYDALLQGDTVVVALQAYVFRVGGDSFVVGTLAPQESVAGAQPAFDAIVKSLRFGV